ncbi:uncharacterized protein LOC128668482 [Microplitis demolitor]|uniref:uncharacterized protein LOC128668482 n=1 Tax=Microplitis demolitor TaxID=69319 RepID=UPI00235B6C92|nr:uncharacterized protein LOC128668482 [Microplitis demolitor]
MTIIEDNGEYICECVSGYLYYPPLDGCFQPYTRGPCSSGNYLAFSPGAFTAECLENPCEEGSVMYQNECHKLLKSGPPCNGSETLIVNEENYEINCQEVIPVVYQVIMAPVRRCAPGSRMAAHGICRQLL